jgi:two-component system OmpR family response regulator
MSDSDKGLEPDQPLVIGNITLDPLRWRVWRRGVEINLTPTEFRILRRLASSAGRLVTRQELISDIWEASWPLAENTLDAHIKGIRKKLELHGPRVLRTVRGVGFALEERANC